MSAPRVPAFAIDDELKRKLLFTLLALVIYRVGAHIAAPGVNVAALADFIRNSGAAGFFGLYDTLGGGLSRATVFALGIMPYISASIIFQLAGGIVPSVGKMQKDEEGRKKITQWTRYLTVFISLSQAYTFALFTESHPRRHPRSRLRLPTHHGADAHRRRDLRDVAGRADHRARDRQRDEPAHHVLDPGAAVAGHHRAGRIHQGRRRLATGRHRSTSRSWSAVIAAVVAMTIAARRIPIQIPRKVMGRGRIREGQKTFIPIRLITAGVMPIIFAQTIIIVPGTLASFTKSPVLQDVANFFAPGDLPYDLTFAILIVVFSYFYTSIIFNSVDLAENLKKQGGFIPGVKPGASTADYIDAVLARVTLPGAPVPGRSSRCCRSSSRSGSASSRTSAGPRCSSWSACCSTRSPRWNSTGPCGSTTGS